MAAPVEDPTVAALLAAADAVAADAMALIEPLVAVSSPSGDHPGLERCVELVAAAVPADAEIERIPCSTTGSAPDLLVRVRGTGSARIVLLGHLDTVIPHDRHRPLERDGDRWTGPGTFDMKGGDALAVGVLNAAATVPGARELFSEVVLLLVADEEWRTEEFVHGPRFDGWDACLCFEGGERTADGDEAVVVRRKAAAAIVVRAAGRSAHAGSRPDDGRNALAALARVALDLTAVHDPRGRQELSVVPTMMRSGTALNVVPDDGELIVDVRAGEIDALEQVLASIPNEKFDVALEARFSRVWPGMDHREAAAPVLARAGELLGRPIVASGRGGASDASHLASWTRVAIDGLGPLGGGAHAVDEHLDAGTLRDRAAVALAVLAGVLAP
ncbi:M20/M25/M40 family metallo-hydrolase [Patulibacter sp.]|uniref:M20/M25/M40 family metallo-hydrolase n=1 Tax=Patulibacter sp. TaxID=1912859 RepID=UPI002718DFB1|nr:M20/M25/M40 family metallo-hydrolase [Patulibacter sp.]MDO9408107.1 M20/M25/M40 family metallo-hydrolase [Patulibacter sp.]